MSRGRHRKLYYVPGLISLILVPLLFVYLGKRKYEELNKSVIEVNLSYYLSPDTLLITYPTDRVYEEIILSTNTEENIAKLTYAKQRLAEMVANNDSAGGIHVSFNDAKYAAYVEAISILYGMENVAKVVSEDGIRYFNIRRSKNNFILCGGVIFEDYTLPEPSFLEKLEMLPETISKEFEFILPALRELWLVLAILSVLVSLSIVGCYRANKTSI